MKVLIAVDGSDFTKRMLQYLASHEGLLGPKHEYTALTVVPAVPPRAYDFLARESIDAYYREEGDTVLLMVSDFAKRHGWSIATRCVVGRIAETVATEATDGGYDLLVMGSHGHTALGNVVLGSVATRVLAGCRTPVLIIR